MFSNVIGKHSNHNTFEVIDAVLVILILISLF